MIADKRLRKYSVLFFLFLLVVASIVYNTLSWNNLQEEERIKLAFQGGERVVITILGDSTTVGAGANGGSEVWKNGLSYAFLNEEYPNISPASPFFINTTGFPTLEQQANKNVPSAVRLLRSEAELRCNKSYVGNFGVSGWEARDHVRAKTMDKIIASKPKPELIFINLGINGAKHRRAQGADLKTLIRSAISSKIVPVLVIPNNIGVAYSSQGDWKLESRPDDWYPKDNWQGFRDEIRDVALSEGVSLIDLGDDSGFLNIRLLYDSFHPNSLGYADIFNKYVHWLDNGGRLN